MNLIRVLYYTLFLDNGGVEHMFYEWIRRIIDDKVQVDIMTEKILSKNMKTKLEELGCIIIEIPYSKYPSRKKRKVISGIIRERQYDIVHAHIMASFQIDVLRAAKCSGVKIRIAHSHNIINKNAKLRTRIMHMIYRYVLKACTTDFFACSELAGKSLFGDKQHFMIVNNGIDLNRFSYTQNGRKKVRDELNLKDEDILVGSVGRLSQQKNYGFLLKVFRNVIDKNKNFYLIIAGAGEEEEALIKEAKNLKLTENIIFYGSTDYIPDVMSAMDIFVLPSLYEGLVLVLVEAQAIGLPCIASNYISNEVNLTNTVTFLPLEITTWVDQIITTGNKKERYDNLHTIENNGYDIQTVGKSLKNWYKAKVIQRV